MQDRWRIKGNVDLLHASFNARYTLDDTVSFLEFIRDRVASDPDFGEPLAEHTRGALVPGTDIEVIWTFNPAERYVEIIAPMPDD